MPTIARLWENSDFTGAWLNIQTNTIYPDLSIYSFNDKASSIEVIDHSYVITLCKDINYGGAAWSFMWRMNGAHLSDFGFNDNTSSIFITFTGDLSTGYVIFCEDINAGGKQSFCTAPASSNNMSGTNWSGALSNDSLSSVIVAPNTNVTLYKDANQSGTSWNLNRCGLAISYTYNATDGYFQNDAVSSFVVQTCP